MDDATRTTPTEDITAGTPTPPTSYPVNGRSTKSAGVLMKEITEGLSTLMRKEIELAKLEVGASVSEKAKGAAIVAVAGVFGFFALIFILLAVRDGIAEFLATWAADLLTALLLLILGAIAVTVARKKLRGPISANMTKKSIKDDLEWAKSLGRD